MTGNPKVKYINRELSWLAFNHRVYEEARDLKNPLMERLKFAAIVASNLDEFFMVRVASLWDQKMAGFKKRGISGMTPEEQIEQITARVRVLYRELYTTYNRSILPALERESIRFAKPETLSESQGRRLKRFFWRNLYPVLTPMVVDASRPFPLIQNRSLNLAVLIAPEKGAEDKPLFGIVQVPQVLGRVVPLDGGSGCRTFMFMEDVIRLYVHEIFKGHSLKDMGFFRITRNADLGVDEEGAHDLLETIQESLKQRKWGHVVRLEVDRGMSGKLIKRLRKEMDVPKQGIYPIGGPLDLSFLMGFASESDREDLKYPPFVPYVEPDLEREDLFGVIRERDVFMHYPYESFEPVVRFVRQAAEDPAVLAIKMTLYRVSGNSPIIQSLARAAENGKQVTVLVELKARFDEEKNIQWAIMLEKAGCHVVYGLLGLKVHSKVLLVVRRESDGIRRYMHLGTGNYNDKTAKLYTDMGLMTANPYLGADVSSLFNMLTGYSKHDDFYKIAVAPNLVETFLHLIDREIAHVRGGKPGRIVAKMNSLVDPVVIDKLYEASEAGVEIDLIVRGICCLRPGVPGMSERIRVRSLVGRFLEHSRIYYFQDNGQDRVFLSSADWMPRNLYRRVELLFPVESQPLREKIKHILDISLQDTVRARIMGPDGSYTRVDRRGKPYLDSQVLFLEEASDTPRTEKDFLGGFVPLTKPD